MNTAIKRALAVFAGTAVALFALAFATEAHAQVSNGTLNGTVASSTSSTTPMITGVSVTGAANGGVTISWNTDVPTTSFVSYGLTSVYGSTTTTDTTLSTSHSVTVYGLTPGTLYHFNVNGSNSSGLRGSSLDQTFFIASSTATTSGSTASSTASSTDVAALSLRISSLESLVRSLQSIINSLQAEVQSLMNTGGSGNTGSGGTGTTTGSSNIPPTSPGITVSPQNASIRAGTNIDFNGRGFWNNEPITVSANGATVASARADGGGNWSTGSIPVSSTTGTETFVFTGAWSGMTGSATVSVTP